MGVGGVGTWSTCFWCRGCWAQALAEEDVYTAPRQIPGGGEAVYGGQGRLQAGKTAAMNEGCVARKGATHFHCHLNPDESARLAEEGDVLAGNPEAYEPRGGNRKEAG